MIQTIEEEKTHSEITNKLRLMLESYKMLKQIKTLRANRTLESIYTFLYLARKNSQSKIARKFLKEIFVESGVKDPKILQQIENIDSYIPDIRNTSRQFSQKDSQIIIERLVENPKECVYNSLTNKVSYPLETTESLQNDFAKIKSGLESLSQSLGKNYSNFEGGFWIDNDGLRHKFTNPRESQMNNWFFYSAKRLNSENNWAQEEITTRVYLHPKIEHWITVWQDILRQLANLSEIRENGFQSKIPNFFKFAPSDFAQMKNQDDRILFYFGDKTNKTALELIANYVKKNPQYFIPTYSLGTPLLIDNKISNCAFVSDDPESTSFNNSHAKIIEEIIISFGTNYMLPNGKNPNIQEILEKCKNDKILKLTLERYLLQKYPEKLPKYGLRIDNIAFLEKT